VEGTVPEELRVKPNGAKEAFVVLERLCLLVFLLVPQAVQPDRQGFWDELLVDIEASALAAIRSKARIHGTQVAELRAARRGVYHAGRAAQSKQDGVRPTLDVDAINDVGVPWDVGDEEVAGVVGGGQAAHALSALGGAERACFIHAGGIAQAGIGALGAGNLGIGRILEQGAVVGGADVLHEFLREDLNRRANIAQIRADACARKRLRCLIAGIFGRRHFERR
jgi:hypothetical protein